MMTRMAEPQSAQEILSILQQIVGESISQIQVLGVNSLKSITPTPQDFVGSKVTKVHAAERSIRIEVGDLSVNLNLQRTGKLIWLESAEPAQIGRPGLPTIRILLGSGPALDFTEPARTKRISVTLSAS